MRFRSLSFLVPFGASVILLAAPSFAYAGMSFTAQVQIGGRSVTETVNIDSCGFTQGLYHSIKKIGSVLPDMLQGSDPAISVYRGGNSCYLYEKYVVSTLETEDLSCVLVESSEDDRTAWNFSERSHWSFLFKSVESEGVDKEHFAGIYRHFMFVDDSCCPGPSHLTIYDLNTGQKVYEVTCEDSVLKNDMMTFWVQERKATDRKECPDERDWENTTPAIDRKFKLDLRTMKETKTAETECHARQ
jgi:hypothetical protein